MENTETTQDSNLNKKEESLFCLDFSKTENGRVKIEIEKYTQESIQCVSVGMYKT